MVNYKPGMGPKIGRILLDFGLSFPNLVGVWLDGILMLIYQIGFGV